MQLYPPVSTPVKILIATLLTGALIAFINSVQNALTPFVLAAVFAYVTAPLADKLEQRRLPAAAAAGLIVCLLLLLILLFPLALVPLIVAQLSELSELLPPLAEKLQTLLGEDIGSWLQAQELQKKLDSSHLQQAVSAAAGALGEGVSALTGFFTLLLITPLATFYFLRDRKSISGAIAEILPPHIREQAVLLGRDLDNVLGEFLHGQLMVMIIMSIFYAVALKLADLPFALTIGILSGMLTFIPYVGFLLGIALATLIGLSSFDSFLDIVVIWGLMGIGTLMESVLITPRLVGERVGLHPLAVLLTIMLFGDLFGFIGVLSALPIGAVLLVCGRYLRRRYIASEFYGHP